MSGMVSATPAKIYAAWLDGDGHAKMTGSAAEGQPVVGARFSAWNGYISGTNLELEPSRRIVQSWRTTEFPADAPDSRLEILFDPIAGGTRVIIRHTGVPDGQRKQYESGWHDHYLAPMATYFGTATKSVKKPAKKPVKKAAKVVKRPKAKRAPAKKKPAKKRTKR